MDTNRMITKLRTYAEKYCTPPLGVEVEGTAGLLYDAAEKMKRLAAYEATGLEPEEVSALESYKLLDEHEREKLFAYLALGSIDHIQYLIQAEEEGRLVVLPFPQGKILLDRSYQQNPELLKNFRVAIAYDHSGIVFHQPLSIFLENVKRGYITEVSKEAEAALEAQKGEDNDITKGA